MEHWVFWGCFGFSRGILGIFVRVPGCSGFSRRCSGVFRVFHTVPGVPGCSGVPVFLELLHAHFRNTLTKRGIFLLGKKLSLLIVTLTGTHVRSKSLSI